ncbi:uncharacterized protein LOC112270205 [Brachypodium distachyon]|uniref:uncharacterized protein LOC112270205 n=1 Tax=Brachypodium distachyon TaxID=15368 RepID=UPI000D0DF58D|nr:uncharacterized protein LOC112270205 [Brachypodium distachyon]|eukprot:XP_024313846.1 uncharacterized protein LOC112270205 [Brachypodium distachyon]
MKGKIGLEHVLPPSSHEVEAFTHEMGLRLRSDSVVELSAGASGAGVPVFSVVRERPEEDALTSGARAAAPEVPEGEPPTQARDGELPTTEGGVRDPLVTVELVRGLVEAVGALPTLKTEVVALSAALDVEMSNWAGLAFDATAIVNRSMEAWSWVGFGGRADVPA